MTPIAASQSPTVMPSLRHFVGRPNQHPVQPAFSPTSDRLFPACLFHNRARSTTLSDSAISYRFFSPLFSFLDNDGFPRIRFPATASLDRNHGAGHETHETNAPTTHGSTVLCTSGFRTDIDWAACRATGLVCTKEWRKVRERIKADATEVSEKDGVCMYVDDILSCYLE